MQAPPGLAAQDCAALSAAVEASLAAHNYANAVFLAERLFAAGASDDTAFVLATAYYRAGKVKQARRVLHERPSTQGREANRFLLARCCVDLGELVEAESLLAPADGAAPMGAAGQELLGTVYRRTNRRDLAIRAFRRALEQDATQWSAYQNLCELAAKIDSAEVFVAGGGGPGVGVPATMTPRAEESAAAAGGGGAPGVMGLLRELGAGYNALCLYQCNTTIERLDALPPAQRNTGWVLAQIGRAYFELVDYAAAEKVFKQMRSVDPMRTEGLEIFSTLLWHLRKEVDLCYLAQQAVALERRAWQCCCVVGNCFALQKEHEAALRFFQRANQTAPAEPYAYTLAGHEHVANEEFDRAQDFFRAAIRHDERHYNAWYGLGYVYYRQEKYELAEYHFTRALQINERSSVLWCYRGLVKAAKAPRDAIPHARYADALEDLESALKIKIAGQPPNALAQYKKASVLERMGRYDESLSVLTSLKTTAPKEPSVQLLLGKVYRKLGQQCEAMHHYNMAVFLDPNKADQVKAQQEKMSRARGHAQSSVRHRPHPIAPPAATPPPRRAASRDLLGRRASARAAFANTAVRCQDEEDDDEDIF